MLRETELMNECVCPLYDHAENNSQRAFRFLDHEELPLNAGAFPGTSW
jgi:hypothetical protein